MNEFMTWLAQQSPAWIFMVFPLIFGGVFLSACNDIRKEEKLEANPCRMTGDQYQDFNDKRMRK